MCIYISTYVYSYMCIRLHRPAEILMAICQVPLSSFVILFVGSYLTWSREEEKLLVCRRCFFPPLVFFQMGCFTSEKSL